MLTGSVILVPGSPLKCVFEIDVLEVRERENSTSSIIKLPLWRVETYLFAVILEQAVRVLKRLRCHGWSTKIVTMVDVKFLESGDFSRQSAEALGMCCIK